jgi:hypothetical protein
MAVGAFGVRAKITSGFGVGYSVNSISELAGNRKRLLNIGY